MRVGTLAYATNQGLGILVKSFYDHGILTDVLIVRHGSRITHTSWYPDADVMSINDFEKAKRFADQMDVMFFFETPFDWRLIPYCKEKGIKTVLMPMYECMPSNLPYMPDLIINPSLLDQQYYPQGVHIPVPVEVPWKARFEARTFVHNAGHGGLKGRNGTKELLEAMPFVQSPISLILRTQEPINWYRSDTRIKLVVGTVPYEDLWEVGDVFIFPEKFNGLSLPLQEARAAGMLVMAADRFPMNQWLPNEPLIPVGRYEQDRIGGCNAFPSAVIEPKAIAQKIDEWYGAGILAFSQGGRSWAEAHSWEVLGPRYQKALAS